MTVYIQSNIPPAEILKDITYVNIRGESGFPKRRDPVHGVDQKVDTDPTFCQVNVANFQIKGIHVP